MLLILAASALSAELVGSAYVPLEDPVYKLIEQCEMRGLIPVGSLNVRPITRLKAATFLLEAAVDYELLGDRILQADLDYYIREYSEECIRLAKEIKPEKRSVRSLSYNPIPSIKASHWHLIRYKNDTFRFICDPLFTFRRDWKTDSEGWNVARRSWGVRFWGDLSGGLGYYFQFVDRLERGRGKYLSREDLLEDRYGYVGPLLGGKETYYDQTDAHLGLKVGRFDLFFGKDRPAWGPSADRLLIGGQGPSYDNLRVGLRLTDFLRFTYLLGKLHPWDVPTDPLYRTEEGWTRLATVNKWLTAHRLDVAIGDNVTIGLSEALVWGERGLDIAYLNPLNFLFSAEHDGGDQDNVLLSVDASCRVLNRGRVWGALLIDDLKLSTIGKGNPGNKVGWTGGIEAGDCGVDGLGARLDYTRLEPYVYSHFYPVNRFSHWTTCLGSDLKPNSDRLRGSFSMRPYREIEIDLSLIHI